MSCARRTVFTVGLAVLLVASACGSTIPRTRVASDRGAALEPAFEPEQSGANAPETSPGVAGTLPGGRPSPTAQLRTGPSTAGQGPAAGRIPVGAGVRGVTNDTIFVGMPDIDLAAVNDVIGAVGGQEGSAAGSTRTIGDAVAAYINKHGGIAGRQLKIVWHQVENVAALATAEGRRRDAQQACATWTEDNKVFAFMGQPLVDPVINDCARENNAVFVPYPGGLAVDKQYFREMRGLWYGVTRMISDRRDRNLVDNLVRRGVLARGAKVGIMTENWEGSRRGVANGMVPALAAHGIEVAATAVYPDVVGSPWDNYVLQFQTAGVTHVLFTQTWDVFPVVLMMRAAENQRWRPKWGIGSDNNPVEVARNAPQPQLANTFAMGWQPWDDLGRFEDGAASARCSEIAQAPVNSTNSPSTWRTHCDVLLFLQAALGRAPEVSPAGMAAAMGALADSYQSMAAIGGRTSFGAGRHDGVAVQRDLSYDPRCADGANCFHYTSEPRPMP